MALITSSAQPAYRGSFMSVNIAVQQVAMGLATQVASLFLHQDHKGGRLEGYALVGLLACHDHLVSILLAGRLRPSGASALPLVEQVLEHQERLPSAARDRPGRGAVLTAPALQLSSQKL